MACPFSWCLPRSICNGNTVTRFMNTDRLKLTEAGGREEHLPRFHLECVLWHNCWALVLDYVKSIQPSHHVQIPHPWVHSIETITEKLAKRTVWLFIYIYICLYTHSKRFSAVLTVCKHRGKRPAEITVGLLKWWLCEELGWGRCLGASWKSREP